MATVRDINDIREIFIAATGSAYINAGHVFDTIIDEHIARHTPELEYDQYDLDNAYEKGYDEGYYHGYHAEREVENGVH